LRAEASGPRAQQFSRLVEECRRASKAARLPAAHPAESVTWVGIGAANQALLWLLTGQRRWLDEARRWIAAAVGWPDWGHLFLVNVDLSAAWLLWGLGLCLDWLGGAIPPEEEEALARELERHARIMRDFKRSTEGEGWSTNWWQNHNWINMNGLATAGYALARRCPEAAEWTDCARENFRIVMSELAPDGSDYEGVAYWRYGVPWLYAYAHMERERGGEDFFTSSSFLRETFWYRLYQAAPGEEETVNFGDCHDARSAHSIAVYYKAAAEYRIPQARWLADRVRTFLFREQYESGIRPGILPEAGLEYLWFDPSVAAEGPESLPTSRFFPDLGLLSSRDSWRGDATLFSVKCGFPGGERQWRRSWEVERERGWSVRGLSHAHPDDCAFVIHSRGAYLACDEGYSREVLTAQHNSITVDGRGYEGEGSNNVWKDRLEESVARLELCELDGERFLFRGDRAQCYPRELGV
ncbi:MAG: DUF4962 domain-containing protein, partial [Spirochaetaceae bacterium]|nr:DUF4962 domain-containing protein [Spirochaetaceae bacterium]